MILGLEHSMKKIYGAGIAVAKHNFEPCIYLTNRFHVVHLFSDRSQMMSKRHNECVTDDFKH